LAHSFIWSGSIRSFGTRASFMFTGSTGSGGVGAPCLRMLGFAMGSLYLHSEIFGKKGDALRRPEVG
jgi:hypothetical protein